MLVLGMKLLGGETITGHRRVVKVERRETKLVWI
jgi:hypothetical protein